ncbi:uncharacterized protein J3D65DRAFT_632062 [Phyllosticta citribraziliensis]|uniref:Uncharacterized protein n=1 Tax=Phyllosticta citribraziliensis TaxID=989973 RepID=A0ABR1LFL4_9PEZI
MEGDALAQAKNTASSLLRRLKTLLVTGCHSSSRSGESSQTTSPVGFPNSKPRTTDASVADRSRSPTPPRLTSRARSGPRNSRKHQSHFSVATPATHTGTSMVRPTLPSKTWSSGRRRGQHLPPPRSNRLKWSASVQLGRRRSGAKSTIRRTRVLLESFARTVTASRTALSRDMIWTCNKKSAGSLPSYSHRMERFHRGAARQVSQCAGSAGPARQIL